MSCSFMVLRARGIIALCGPFGAFFFELGFGLPVRRAMFHGNGRIQASANIESSKQPHVAGPGGGYEFIQNLVTDRFVKRAAAYSPT